MKKLSVLLVFVSLIATSFAQNDIKPCGQLPQLNPTVKAKCLTNINQVFSENLPTNFLKDKNYTSNFKLIIDCNGRIDMVIYKKGNFSPEQQKHFLLKINKLKDWQAGKNKNTDVSTTVYFTINIENRKVTYKQY